MILILGLGTLFLLSYEEPNRFGALRLENTGLERCIRDIEECCQVIAGVNGSSNEHLAGELDWWKSDRGWSEDAAVPASPFRG
jgi:hypothetical protein